MTAKDKLEEKLHNLAQAIGSDDKLVDNVMSRTDKKSVTHSSISQIQYTWSIIMKSPFTKLAAAVVIIIAVLTITFLDKSATPAYGMSDMLELISKAKTLHIRGWYVGRYGSPPKEIKLPFEHWYDLENGCYRKDYSGISLDKSKIDHYSTICDGEYIMSEGRYQPIGDRIHKTIDFEKIGPSKNNIKWLEWYGRLRQIEGFYKIGQDIINGEKYDIWEGEFNRGVKHITRVRLQTWLSPTTAQVGRSKTWQKKDNEDWIQVNEYTIFERNVSLPEGIFKTEPPAGHEIKTAKEDATIRVWQERDIYEGTQFNYAPLMYWVEPVFLLKDGSFLACWQSVDAKESRDQSKYFQNLQTGGDLPKLPTEVFALSPEPNVRDMQFIGYHLAFTQKETEKGRRWYEWSLYVPDKEPPPLSAVLDYRIHCRLNIKRTKNIGNSVNQVAISKPKKIETEEDFNTFVLGAMAELSDDGKAPQGVTYEGVLELTRQIRKSMTQ